jgi:uncharacterized protein
VLSALAAAGCGDGDDDDEPRRSQASLDRALIAASWENDVARARELIRQGADVNYEDRTEQSAYLIATSEGYLRLLRLTLANGADVNAKDSYNGTGLIRAAERGHDRVVRRLLAAGIDKDHVNRLGWTALHEAIVLGDGGPSHVRTVRELVNGGVDVNVPDGGGVRALAHARERGYDEIVALLEGAGARP